jgi:hypothetical protein
MIPTGGPPVKLRGFLMLVGGAQRETDSARTYTFDMMASGQQGSL